MLTLEQYQAAQAKASENAFKSLEAGEYIFKIKNVSTDVAKKGFNAGKTVIKFRANPLKNNNDAESVDQSRTLFAEVAVMPETTEITEANAESVDRAVNALAYWAECLGLVRGKPDRKTDKEAYSKWSYQAALTLCSAPEAALGNFFRGTVKVTPSADGEKTFANLVKKEPL